MGEKLNIVFLIDALGWEIAEHFGFCNRLSFRAGPLETVLGYSSAAIPSLLTGELPNRHGSWLMYRLARDDSPFRFLRYLPKLPHAVERRLRLLLKRSIDRRGVIRGYYSLYDVPLHILGDFDVAFKADPYAVGQMPLKTVFDEAAEFGIPFKVWTYRTPEEENMRELFSAIEGNDRLLFLYTPELDALMHRVGIFHPDVGRKLQIYEAFVASILEKAGNRGKAISLYLLSDHGMTDVKDGVDVPSSVSRLGYRVKGDYTAFYDSTIARFWCSEPVASRIMESLGGTGWGRILSEEELRTYGCFFEDESYGKQIFLCSPGLMIVPSFMGKQRLAAMHGYDPADRFSKGCFLTNDPEGELPHSILGIKDFLIGKMARGA